MSSREYKSKINKGPVSSFFGNHRNYQSEAQLSYIQQNEIA